MKSRAQPFSCAIASRPVRISLRHGGGLQEPGRVYVRCEERDCQYVDLNEAPCPLRPDMFSDGSDRLIAAHVRAHVGDRVCFGCLTEKLGITHDQVRRASWSLKDAPGMSIRPARCVACQGRRVTIGLARSAALNGDATPASPRDDSATGETARVGASLRRRAGYSLCAHCLARDLATDVSLVREAMSHLERDRAFGMRTSQCVSCLLVKRVIRFDEAPPEDDAPRRIVQFLLQAAGTKACASCVAFSTDLPLALVRRTFNVLEPVQEFDRQEAPCSACGRWQVVIQFLQAEASHEGGAELADIVSGHVRHRDARIDLLSFRVRDGWRPFALVKAGAGALMPDVPAIVLDVMPTKLEADQRAGEHARAWIDTHTP